MNETYVHICELGISYIIIGVLYILTKNNIYLNR